MGGGREWGRLERGESGGEWGEWGRVSTCLVGGVLLAGADLGGVLLGADLGGVLLGADLGGVLPDMTAAW